MEVKRFEIELHEKDIKGIVESLKKGEIASGSAVQNFEIRIARLAKKKYAACVSNGFSALFMAINSLGFKNKRIAIPALSTCYAMLSAVRASGNSPVLIDVEPHTANISIKSMKEVSKNKKIDLVISPNHLGIKSDIPALKSLGFKVIENCAQSAGTEWLRKRKSKSDIKIFSFYPTKIINGIDGGAVTSDRKKWIDKVKDTRYYGGILNDDGIIRYNCKMQNINAVLGISYLERMKEIVKKRLQIANKYIRIIKKYSPDVDYLHSDNDQEITFQKFIIRFKKKQLCKQFMKEMTGRGINSGGEFMFLGAPGQLGSYPKAAMLYSTHCSLPLYETLTAKKIDYICDAIDDSIKKVIQ